MATICKKVCDRCGKEIHYIGWTSKLKKNWFIKSIERKSKWV